MKWNIYDIRLSTIIDQLVSYAFLAISMDCPFYLNELDGCFSIEVNKGAFKDFEEEKNIIYSIKKQWRNNQNNPIPSSTIGIEDSGFTTISSSIIVIIPINKCECDKIKKYKDDKIIKPFIINCAEACLRNLYFRFNIAAEGKNFIFPDIFDIPLFYAYIFFNNILEKKIIWETMFPNINTATSNYNYIFNQKYSNNDTWMYLYNKAIYSKKTHNYIDSIVYFAMAFETLIYAKIKSIKQYDEEVEKYCVEYDDNGIEQTLYPKSLLIKMQKDGYIMTELSKTKLGDLVYKILEPRNKIMHGKTNIYDDLSAQCENAHNAAIELFPILYFSEKSLKCTIVKNISFNIGLLTNNNYSESKKSYMVAQNNIFVCMTHIINIVKEIMFNKKELYDEFNNTIEQLKTLSVDETKLNWFLSEMFFILGRFDTALQYLNLISESSRNEIITFLEGSILLSKNQYDKGLQICKKLEDNYQDNNSSAVLRLKYSLMNNDFSYIEYFLNQISPNQFEILTYYYKLLITIKSYLNKDEILTKLQDFLENIKNINSSGIYFPNYEFFTIIDKNKVIELLSNINKELNNGNPIFQSKINKYLQFNDCPYTLSVDRFKDIEFNKSNNDIVSIEFPFQIHCIGDIGDYYFSLNY